MAETLKAVGEELAQMCLWDSAEWRHSGTRTAEILRFGPVILKSRPKVYQNSTDLAKIRKDTNNKSNP